MCYEKCIVDIYHCKIPFIWVIPLSEVVIYNQFDKISSLSWGEIFNFAINCWLCGIESRVLALTRNWYSFSIHFITIALFEVLHHYKMCRMGRMIITEYFQLCISYNLALECLWNTVFESGCQLKSTRPSFSQKRTEKLPFHGIVTVFN